MVTLTNNFSIPFTDDINISGGVQFKDAVSTSVVYSIAVAGTQTALLDINAVSLTSSYNITITQIEILIEPIFVNSYSAPVTALMNIAGEVHVTFIPSYRPPYTLPNSITQAHTLDINEVISMPYTEPILGLYPATLIIPNYHASTTYELLGILGLGIGHVIAPSINLLTS